MWIRGVLALIFLPLQALPDSQSEDHLAFPFSISSTILQFLLFNCLSGSIFPSAWLPALSLTSSSPTPRNHINLTPAVLTVLRRWKISHPGIDSEAHNHSTRCERCSIRFYSFSLTRDIAVSSGRQKRDLVPRCSRRKLFPCGQSAAERIKPQKKKKLSYSDKQRRDANHKLTEIRRRKRRPQSVCDKTRLTSTTDIFFNQSQTAKPFNLTDPSSVWRSLPNHN